MRIEYVDNKSVIEQLLKAGAEKTLLDANGDSPLSWAILRTVWCRIRGSVIAASNSLGPQLMRQFS